MRKVQVVLSVGKVSRKNSTTCQINFIHWDLGTTWMQTTIYIAYIIREISHCYSVRIDCMVNNKSFLDAWNLSEGVENRWLWIDVVLLWGMINNKQIIIIPWVDASQELANCLIMKVVSTEQLELSSSGDW